ncbi:MAG: hypothetical protein ACI9LM_003762 [Alteromonadaceae bacterium]|jgi:hypothetical protein
MNSAKKITITPTLTNLAVARKRQVSLIDTFYYHCISRGVHRAFLCGADKATGQSFEHRRDWVEGKLLFLGSVFAIDVCVYAVISNHSHLVLYVDEDKAKSWSTLILFVVGISCSKAPC